MPGTIQELIDKDYDLWVYCEGRNCTHGRRIDLKQLALKLGPEHPALSVDLTPHFRCSKCMGPKGKVSIRITPYASRPSGIYGAWSGRDAKKD